MIAGLATGLTWLRAFKGPCLALALGGVLVGGAGGYKLASAIADGRVARAEKALSDFRLEIAAARTAILERDKQISDLVEESRLEHKAGVDAVADAVRDMGRRLQLCATKSDVRVTLSAEGAIEAVPGEQLRDLAESVREYAEACGRGRDRDAVDHNSLVDWIERHAK